MSYESEWTNIGFEVPHHDCAVVGARNALFQVRVEACGNNSFFMALE